MRIVVTWILLRQEAVKDLCFPLPIIISRYPFPSNSSLFVPPPEKKKRVEPSNKLATFPNMNNTELCVCRGDDRIFTPVCWHFHPPPPPPPPLLCKMDQWNWRAKTTPWNVSNSYRPIGWLLFKSIFVCSFTSTHTHECVLICIRGVCEYAYKVMRT